MVIDLARPWPDIHARLEGLVMDAFRRTARLESVAGFGASA